MTDDLTITRSSDKGLKLTRLPAAVREMSPRFAPKQEGGREIGGNGALLVLQGPEGHVSRKTR